LCLSYSEKIGSPVTGKNKGRSIAAEAYVPEEIEN
jgi:hypothetical protein